MGAVSGRLLAPHHLIDFVLALMVLRLQAVPRVVRESDILKPLVGVHVLVVDHDKEARALLEAVLTYGGAFVTAVAKAEEALDFLRRTPVDVIVAEVLSPGKNGYWLVQQIDGRIPVVALAAGPDDGPDRTLASGFQAHMRKPVDPWELCRLVVGLARKP